MLKRLQNWLFPPKCVLCKKLLTKDETDLCTQCRSQTPRFENTKIRFSFIAGWTGVWYYKDMVRQSFLRFKFYGKRSYAKIYGKMIALKLVQEQMEGFDILTWIPVSRRRRFARGFDQVELLALEVAKQLGITAVSTLKKIRHTPPQSGLGDAAHRRANVLNAFRLRDQVQVQGKKILLLDDIVTTGATASECARVLMTAGAKEVQLAVLAVANHEKK